MDLEEISLRLTLLDSAVDLLAEQVSGLLTRQVIELIDRLEDESQIESTLAELRSGVLDEEIDLVLAEILDMYRSELELTLTRFDEVPTEEDEAQAAQLAAGAISVAEGSLTSALSQIAATASLGALTGIAILVEKFTEPAIRELKVDLSNNIAGYRSAIEISKGEQRNPGGASYVYLGPLDNRNREFCRDILTRKPAYTLEEIKELDSDPRAQLLPVLVFGGGYGCRHRWIYTDGV